MANYVFETMTSDQAAAFTTADFLVFTNSASNAFTVAVAPLAGSGGLINSGLTVTDAAGKSLTFGAAALSGASLNGRVVFNDSSSLLLGSADTASPDTIPSGTTVNTGNDAIYGFAGNDTLSGGNGNDYIYGGTGADSLLGGNGNDHIFGNAAGSGGGDETQTQTTGGPAPAPIFTFNDYIDGGSGSDYINGNAGNDSIFGGDGSDRIFGGNGDDTISGDAGNDTINGNLGNDSISGGDGNDFARGGQGNDTVNGNAGDDILKGDLGNDSLVGGVGFDVVEGGAGNDTFGFATGDATISYTQGSGGTVTYGSAGATATVTDLITDYSDGSDKLALGFTVTGVLKAAGATFTTMAAAQTQAQQLITASATAGSIAAINVGSDTYLFYNDGGTAAGSTTSINAIRVAGVDAAVFNGGAVGVSDFV